MALQLFEGMAFVLLCCFLCRLLFVLLVLDFVHQRPNVVETERSLGMKFQQAGRILHTSMFIRVAPAPARLNASKYVT